MALPIALVCTAGLPSAFAGAAPDSGHYTLGLKITDSGGSSQTQDWSTQLSYDPTTGGLQTPDLSWHSSDLVGGIWSSAGNVKVTGNVDPFLSYSFSAKNNTSSVQTYTFSYGESIVPPVSGAYSIYSDLAGSLTHGQISSFAQLAPVLGDLDGDGLSEIQTLKLSTDGGATFLNAGVDVGQSQSYTPNGTTFFGPASATLIGNLPFVNYWQFDVSFSLTPGKDATALSGYAEISAIPEPSTYAGIMGAMVLFGVALRRRLGFAV